MRKSLLPIFALCLLAFCAHGQTVAPIQGLGSVQFFSNTGVPLTSGVLYSYQAGTTTQQATFTDSTGLISNPNPIPFTSGARANVWLTIGSFYKFVLCTQNDGTSCAPADVLFSVDQVPGGSSGGGGGGPNFTGVFISSTANPSTTGALRIANSDSICWRNAANSANLCFSMNGNNLLNWAGGSLSLPQINSIAAQCAPNFDFLWGDNTANRLLMCNNGGPAVQVVGSGADINTSDQVTQLHFGSTAAPLSATAPTTNQFLQWNGTSIVGSTPSNFPSVVYSTPLTAGNTTIAPVVVFTVGASNADFRMTAFIDQTALGVGCSTSSTQQMSFTFTDPNTVTPSSSILVSAVATANGSIGTTNSTGQVILASTFRAKAGTNISVFTTYLNGTCTTTQPAFQVLPVLEQLTAN